MANKPLKDYDNISLKPENLSGQLDFDDIFGRSAPLHIEIGSGKGTFLLAQAQDQPQVNFLGIEWANKYFRLAVDRIGRWQLTNVRIIRTDAREFFIKHIGNGAVSCLHIYFPDPWPKKRHHKRRLIQAVNIEQFIRCLKSGGIINIATDHAGYFEQISEVVAREVSVGKLEPAEFIRTAGAGDGEIAGTNFERKYITDGREIYTIAAGKV